MRISLPDSILEDLRDSSRSARSAFFYPGIRGYGIRGYEPPQREIIRKSRESRVLGRAPCTSVLIYIRHRAASSCQKVTKFLAPSSYSLTRARPIT